MGKVDIKCFGHSFVSGLQHHFKDQTDRPKFIPVPEWVAGTQLENNKVDNVYLHGYRGAQITDFNVHSLHSLIDKDKPTQIILDFGSNDLANDVPALTVADAVHNLATELTQKKNVKHIAVCSRLPRTTNLSPDMNEDTFRIRNMKR